MELKQQFTTKKLCVVTDNTHITCSHHFSSNLSIKNMFGIMHTSSDRQNLLTLPQQKQFGRCVFSYPTFLEDKLSARYLQTFRIFKQHPKPRLFTLCWHTIPLHLATAHASDSTVVHIITYTLGMLKPFIFRNRFFTGYRKAYCERDNCHRSLRACYQSIACCFTAVWPAFQTHGRQRRETKDSGVSKR